MPKSAKSLQDAPFLAAALEGLDLQRKRIEEQIAQVRAMLGGRRVSLGGGTAVKAAQKRVLSPEARKRIAAAQKKRWADYRKKQAAQAKEA